MKNIRIWIVTSVFICIVVFIPFFSYYKFPISGIEIGRDGDFKRYNFPGNGKEDDPYRIENKKISKGRKGIRIYHTTKHVIIQNCIIQGAGIGIRLNYLVSGRIHIINCTIMNCGRAFSIDWVLEGVKIEGNEVISNDWSGIILDTQNTVISQNNFQDNFVGLKILSFDGQEMYNFCIENNTIRNSPINGFFLRDTVNVTIRNNYFLNSSLNLDDSYNWFSDDVFSEKDVIETFKVENNYVNDKPLGFFFDLNNFDFVEKFGQLFFFDCSNITILDQDLRNVERGIFAGKCNNISTIDTFFDYSLQYYTFWRSGIYFYQSSNISFYNVTFIEGYQNSVKYVNCYSIYIMDCNFYKTIRSCISFIGSSQGEVIGNIFEIAEDVELFSDYSDLGTFIVENNTVIYF
ncbi:MAG: hypothetical protein HGN29_05560 [Asgard group archaeon]|nr:hypothetical protein [Asgard group archaeon]